MPPEQSARTVAIQTALGPDELVLRRAVIRDGMSRLFEIDVELYSTKTSLSFDQLVASNATIRLALPGQETRYWNGFIQKFRQVRCEGRLSAYEATLVPWTWFLTRTGDCRIFQKKKVPDIIKEVFREKGFTDFKDSLSASYPEWDYCVQYRETDFDFVSRLMEQEGISYFFEHEDGKHKLVLCDAPSAHSAFAGYDKVRFREQDGGFRDTEYINEWMVEQQVRTGKFATTDYNFEKPKSSLLSKAQVKRKHPLSEFEIFDYPGEFQEQSVGESHYAKVRVQSLQVPFEMARGRADARGIASGYTFTLEDFPRSDQNKKYLVLETEHILHSDEFQAGGEGPEAPFHECRFSVMPADQPYRPPEVTSKPMIRGPQTALVVGPSGEEIYTDKYGRVKVQFHWDRYGKMDENSSCWIRVSQGWAGKNWGSMFLPRIGHEVIVEFLEGDPDRPIITGRVYNGEAMPPYGLPGDKTRSTIKTNSSKGGGGFNEIRFEDKKGKEQVFIHAEKDQDIRTKNDEKSWVGRDLHRIVKRDHFDEIKGDQHETVKGDEMRKVQGDHHETVKGAHHEKVGKAYHLTVGAALSQKIARDLGTKAGGNINTQAGQNINTKAGMNMMTKSGMNYAVQSGMKIELKAGMAAVVEAGLSLTLKAGPSFVVLGPDGVSIMGPMVKINTGGAPSPAVGAMPAPPAPPEPPDPPKAPKEADKDKAGKIAKFKSKAGKVAKAKLTSVKVSARKRLAEVGSSAKAAVLKQAAENGTPFCEKCEEAKRRGH